MAVAEIKLASGIGDDLRKLSRVQAKRDILAWMVYADHFCEDIHAKYCRDQVLREKKIRSWSAARSGRGCSILKCGKLHEHPHLREHRDVVLAYNSRWWIRDNERE